MHRENSCFHREEWARYLVENRRWREDTNLQCTELKRVRIRYRSAMCIEAKIFRLSALRSGRRYIIHWAQTPKCHIMPRSNRLTVNQSRDRWWYRMPNRRRPWVRVRARDRAKWSDHQKEWEHPIWPRDLRFQLQPRSMSIRCLAPRWSIWRDRDWHSSKLMVLIPSCSNERKRCFFGIVLALYLELYHFVLSVARNVGHFSLSFTSWDVDAKNC